MKREPKDRVLYSNYDLYEQYKDCLVEDENGEMDLDEIYVQDDLAWEDFKADLNNFFDGISNRIILVGTVGRWDGLYKAGAISSDFDELFYKAIKDCDYIKFYDVNGHLYLGCSHHDGTNEFEIKILTDRGEEYLDRWERSWDNRTEADVHTQIVDRYSVLPHFAHKVYGMPKTAYVKKGE